MLYFLLLLLIGAVAVVLLSTAVAVAVVVWFGSGVNRVGLLWILSLTTRGKYPLGHELEGLGGGIRGKDRRRVARLIGQLHRGQTLGESLAATPGLVPLETALLAQVAEEQSASVASVFAHESARLLRIREVSISVTGSPWFSFIYLVLVPLEMITILTGIMIFIIPKFKKIFDDFGSALPPLTELLIVSSDFVARFWYLLFAPVILAMYAVLFWMFRGSFAKTPLRILKLWPSSRRKRSALALRAIQIAVRENLALESVLATLAKRHPSEPDRRLFQKLCNRVAEGEEVWEALRVEGFISRRDAELFRAAAGVGNLTWALHYVIERGEDRAVRRLAAKLEWTQPLLVIGLGAVVAFVCIALFLPLIELISDLS